ncbi:MAG: hypothetical protein M0Z38_03815 [Deltaproteobacteria bacterium]|nr:hypothetical protein [Deltaproteobacteria bacterium]
MKTLRNEKGFALGFVLILAAIALTMTLAMLLMVGRGSFISGQQMRFRTAVEASRGGVEAMLQLIASRGATSTPYTNQVLTAGVATKMSGVTGTWGGLDNTLTIDPGTASTYDMRIDLGAYRVYTKIVDTVDGNSGADEGLLKSAVVNSGSGEVTVVSVPYLYTIEVLSQSQVNPTERSRLSVLYQY